MRDLKYFKQLLTVSATLVSTLVWGLPGDNEQPINIQADSAEQSITDGTEKTIYTGNVIMTQGSLLINGGQVTIFTKDHEVTQIIATGKPAHFKQQSGLEKKPIKAYANRINYDLEDETVVMLDDALLRQGGDTVEGKRIDYNIATERVKARSASNSQIHMVLQPKRKKATNGNTDSK